MSNQNLYDIIGSIVAEDIINPLTGEVLSIAGDRVTKRLINKCLAASIDYILIK